MDTQHVEMDFQISLQSGDFPITFFPCRIKACYVCICLTGYAISEVDLRQYRFEENDIIEVFPGQILAFNEKSDDFTIAWFSFSDNMLDEVLYRLPSDFIGFLKETVKYSLPVADREQIITDYFIPIHKIFHDSSNICRREMILNLLHNYYLHLYSKVVLNKKINPQITERKRKKELQDAFFRLIKDNTHIREVAFFAEKLCITSKYLTVITKETTGSTAKDLIDKFAITELKLRLKNTSTPLKTIAEQLHYPGEAFLCKFFRKHTGVTPSYYRNTSK